MTAVTDVSECFKMLDINGDGKVERWELKKVLELLDPLFFDDEKIEAIFSAIDSNNNSRISIDEFLYWTFQDDAKTDLDNVMAGLTKKSSEVKALRVVTSAAAGGMKWLKGVLGVNDKIAEEPLGKKTLGKDSVEEKAHHKQSSAELLSKLEFLRNVPLFRCLPAHAHPSLANALEKVSFKDGDVVISQGDIGDEFFVIQEGEATLTRFPGEDARKNQVTTLKAGDYFGENELLRDDPRTVTVVASAELSCLRLTRSKFHEMNLGEYLHFPKRDNVWNGRNDCADSNIAVKKTPEQTRLIIDALRSLSKYGVSSGDEENASLSEQFWSVEVKLGESVTIKNEVNDYFYIVQAGTLKYALDDCEDTDSNELRCTPVSSLEYSEEKTMATTLTSGCCFGELALLHNSLSEATVTAKEDSSLWAISRKQFKESFMKESEEKRLRYCEYLDRVMQFNTLLKEEKSKLAAAVLEVDFRDGEVIYKQGDNGSDMFVLYEGELSMETNGEVVTKLQADTRQALIFGFGSLLEGEVRSSTVKACGDARCLSLDRQSFEILLGPLKDILGDKSLNSSLLPARERIHRKDLKKIGLIGCGGFAAVELYEHLQTNESYALKAVSKGYIKKTGMESSIMNEKWIQSAFNSPFIIKLYECYNGNQSLYFLLEAALGGELFATYNRKGFHGSVPHAKFYVASAVFALDHMHECNVLYRAIKPEDMLIDADGNCKLCDFGLSKFIVGKTYTTCGTPDYFAPELISSKGHSFPVDWWCLGVLLFELLSGHPPFESAFPMQIYQKVVQGIDKIPFPEKCGGPVEHLIKACCRPSPEERLPMKPGGTKNIKNHIWYKEYDWDSHFNLTMEPPYKPIVKSKTDIGNFNARKADLPRMIEYVDDGTGWDRDFATC